MIKNPELLNNFEDSFMENEGKLPFDRAIKLFTSIWNEGLKFGELPSKDPLEGIDVDIRIAHDKSARFYARSWFYNPHFYTTSSS